MNSIALDRNQSQVFTPDSNQTTSDKVTGVASSATPAVTFENVKSKSTDVPKVGKSGIQLDPPNAAVNDTINEFTITGMQAMQAMTRLYSTVLKSVDSIIGGSPNIRTKISDAADFELELAKITDQLKGAQSSIQKQDLSITKERHKKEMDANAEKLIESEAAAKEAQKAGLASKVFGWISVAASVLAGIAMIATGAGAVAGVAMIVGGVIDATTRILDHAGVDNPIAQKVLMALSIAVTVVSVVVTFGGAGAAKLAEVTAKAPQTILKTVNSLSTKVGNGLTKVAEINIKAASTSAKAVKISSETTDVLANVGQGVSNLVSGIKRANVTGIEADLKNSSAAMELINAQMDKIKENISKVFESNQNIMDALMRIIQERYDVLNSVAQNNKSIV